MGLEDAASGTSSTQGSPTGSCCCSRAVTTSSGARGFHTTAARPAGNPGPERVPGSWRVEALEEATQLGGVGVVDGPADVGGASPRRGPSGADPAVRALGDVGRDLLGEGAQPVPARGAHRERLDHLLDTVVVVRPPGAAELQGRRDEHGDERAHRRCGEREGPGRGTGDGEGEGEDGSDDRQGRSEPSERREGAARGVGPVRPAVVGLVTSGTGGTGPASARRRTGAPRPRRTARARPARPGHHAGPARPPGGPAPG